MSSFACVRCGSPDSQEKAPIPGPSGKELLEKICLPCYTQWKNTEVMIINEYRLNLLERNDRAVLRKNMRDFLNLDETHPTGAAPSMRPPDYTPEST